MTSSKINKHDVDSSIATAEFVQQQLASITETGIPKLNVYPLSVVSSTEGQTVFNIDLDTFDKNTDTVLVQSERTMLFPTLDFSIVNNTVVLNEGVPAGRTIGIYVFKNVPIGEEGSVSGIVLAPNSIPLNRFAGEIATPDYVDQQIAKSAEVGVPKLMVYPLSQVSTSDNQTIFNISLNTFDATTDTVLVQSGRTMLFPNEDFTVSGKTVVLNEGVPKDVVIGIYVFKNVPLGEDGSVSGVVIAPNSIPLDRLGEGNINSSIFGLFGGYGKVQADNGLIMLLSRLNANDDNTYRSLRLMNSNYSASVENALRILDKVNGAVTEYKIYGEHNPPSVNNNIFINSNFANPVNQRGYVSGTDVMGGYSVDRWRGNLNFLLVENSYTTFRPITGTTSNTVIQLIENPAQYVGKKLTMSVKCRTSTPEVQIQLFADGTADGSYSSLGYYAKHLSKANEWEVITQTFNVTKTYSELKFGTNTGGTFDVEWMKLEIGEVATPYVPRLYAEELELCKRYFQIIKSPGGFYRVCSVVTNKKTEKFGFFNFEKEMRRIPTFSYSLNSARLWLSNGVNAMNHAITSIEFTGGASTKSTTVFFTHETSDYTNSGHFLITPEDYIALDAEL